jgi:hypothetical protein
MSDAGQAQWSRPDIPRPGPLAARFGYHGRYVQL